MPDDPSRPASGQQPDPRPTAGAPAWWGALGRPDLPLDGESEAQPRRLAPPAHREADPLTTSRLPLPNQWRAWAFNLAVLAVAVLIVCVGVGALSPGLFLTAALLFGVPLTLATVTAMVVARRSR